ncbi:uncharacterized protein LOC142559638 [Dermacentor variabilis]|uniref:uncharacterized protein LOC142559638 n=1 Tax=Dermacentor variabilis TaxID=34621 RepID=UPI003F5CB9AA
MFFLYLNFVFTIAAASPRGASVPFKYDKPNWTDLIEALNTSQKIWLKQRNYPTDSDCTYWQRTWLNKTDYFFDEWFRKEPQWKKYQERANLVNESNVPVMKIRLQVEKESKATPYKFQYWTSKEKCGIFNYTDASGTSRCEQHAWNSNITTTGECDKAFQTICGDVSYQVYKHSCIDPKYICVGFKSRC